MKNVTQPNNCYVQTQLNSSYCDPILWSIYISIQWVYHALVQRFVFGIYNYYSCLNEQITHLV